MTGVEQLRAHVAAWGGLNAADATQLLDLLEQSGHHVEWGIPVPAGCLDLNVLGPWAVEFVDETVAADLREAGVGVWTRVVGPWEQVGDRG